MFNPYRHLEWDTIKPLPYVTDPIDRICTDCPWPKRCGKDRICWLEESKHPRPKRELIADLDRDKKTGREKLSRDDILEAIREWHRKHGRIPTTAELEGVGIRHGVLKRKCGGVQQAVKDAGLTYKRDLSSRKKWNHRKSL